jgi:Zn-dependent peptidase ImmA (M78 family)
MKVLLEEFRKRGVRVYFAPLQYCSGALRYSRGVWFCVINSLKPVVHQRFTLAHELYHFDHHKHLSNLFTDYATNSELEREANRGAAELLMPLDQVRAFWVALSGLPYSYDDRISILARGLMVSREAMRIRLKEIFCEGR